jgi:hypothetical protein
MQTDQTPPLLQADQGFAIKDSMTTPQEEPLLQADQGFAIKDSMTTPQEESNIKMLLSLELVRRFFIFHLDLSCRLRSSR